VFVLNQSFNQQTLEVVKLDLCPLPLELGQPHTVFGFLNA
jgi:hypothetical protein